MIHRRPAGRAALRGVRALLAALVLSLAGPADPSSQSPAGGMDRSPQEGAGRRIYREGALPSGEPLRARVKGDVPLVATMAACANCHRRSGMGTIEGRTVVRPVTGAALYRPLEVYGAITGREPLPHETDTWPAYTDETLARAIREGIGANGRLLDAAMPRYTIGDRDLSLLVSYLKSLSTADSPGVTDSAIRFATVIDAKVDPARRKAMLDVLQIYARDLSAGTRQETRRSLKAPPEMARRYRAHRDMELDIWELSGPEETWEAQLEDLYRRRPVFALLSGLVEGRWETVHRFCQRFEVPCLLPNTDLPFLSDDGYFTVYFSKGHALEAEAVARHLAEERKSPSGGPIVQIYQDDEAGAVAAAAFKEAIRKEGAGDLKDRRVADGESLTADFWRALLAEDRPSAVVLWMDDPDLRGLGAVGDSGTSLARVYLSGSFGAGPRTPIPASLAGRVRLAHPFILPEDEPRRFARTRPWLKAKRIVAPDERLQMNTFFAATLAGEALDQLLGYFSRDYFLERIEHMTESMPVSTAFPHVSLGPGQRHASKGCYILEYAKDAGGKMTPAGGWIVP